MIDSLENPDVFQAELEAAGFGIFTSIYSAYTNNFGSRCMVGTGVK